MKQVKWLILAVLLILAACQPNPQNVVTIVDGDQITTIESTSNLPSEILEQAGISLSDSDRVLVNDSVIELNDPLPGVEPFTLQVRRALQITIIQPGVDPLKFQTSAWTVGQALEEAGIHPNIADRISPPSETAINGDLEVVFQPARTLTISTDGQVIEVRSSEEQVGQALAEAGISLQGLDHSIPDESEPIPEDGQVQVVRVQEAVNLSYKKIPFKSDFQPTADLELDQQAIIQVGEEGLAINRERVRTEDGIETFHQSENEAVIRTSKDEVVGYGTQVVIRTMQTADGPIEYWRARWVYATAYSPCGIYDPATLGGTRCFYNTATGKPVRRGVAAVIRSWFYAMRGQPIYVPDYGFATIEDVGAGFRDRDWIDLGFTDADLVPWSQWTMVYWLTPVPDSILYVLP